MSMMGFVERVLTIPVQIAFSVLVLQVFIRRQSRWLWFAIAWHTLVDALAVFLLQRWSGYEWSVIALEGVISIFSIASVLFILALKPPETYGDADVEGADQVSAPLLDIAELPEEEVTGEDLDDSRYM
jgi:hypothetical protein